MNISHSVLTSDKHCWFQLLYDRNCAQAYPNSFTFLSHQIKESEKKERKKEKKKEKKIDR